MDLEKELGVVVRVWRGKGSGLEAEHRRPGQGVMLLTLSRGKKKGSQGTVQGLRGGQPCVHGRNVASSLPLDPSLKAKALSCMCIRRPWVAGLESSPQQLS